MFMVPREPEEPEPVAAEPPHAARVTVTAAAAASVLKSRGRPTAMPASASICYLRHDSSPLNSGKTLAKAHWFPQRKTRSIEYKRWLCASRGALARRVQG